MTARQPFAPSYGTNQILTANSGSQFISGLPPSDKQIRVVNSGAAKAYVRAFNSQAGTVTKAATTADFCIPAGMASTVTKGDGIDSIAYISATGTTLEVMTGEGF